MLDLEAPFLIDICMSTKQVCQRILSQIVNDLNFRFSMSIIWKITIFAVTRYFLNLEASFWQAFACR